MMEPHSLPRVKPSPCSGVFKTLQPLTVPPASSLPLAGHHYSTLKPQVRKQVLQTSPAFCLLFNFTSSSGTFLSREMAPLPGLQAQPSGILSSSLTLMPWTQWVSKVALLHMEPQCHCPPPFSMTHVLSLCLKAFLSPKISGTPP